MASSDARLPHTLWQVRNYSFPDKVRNIEHFYRKHAPNFKVFIDDACHMPENWYQTYAAPPQWGNAGNSNWASKYAAAGFIPAMIYDSPFVTDDWKQASASLVVLFARQYAAGPAIAQQQCLQRLRERSSAWQATNGSRHFFVFTDSRGPCCLDGKYKDVDFLNHHIIGPHGEVYDDDKPFFRRGGGPPLRCFDSQKDVNIPTPNIHFPRTGYAKNLHPKSVSSGESPRTLLMFAVGWNYGTRMRLFDIYHNDSEVFVRRKRDYNDYIRHLKIAKFCPVIGGFSQWTPRLAEVMYFDCVPVILTKEWLLPWSDILDWDSFSIRIEPTEANLLGLKDKLKTLDYQKMVKGVRAVKQALWYQLGSYQGTGMLPLLLYQMHYVLSFPQTSQVQVRQTFNDVETDRDYDVGLPNVTQQKAHRVTSRAGLAIVGTHGVREDWVCRTPDGYMCFCYEQHKKEKKYIPGYRTSSTLKITGYRTSSAQKKLGYRASSTQKKTGYRASSTQKNPHLPQLV